jgi:DNA invertase Pin-like site-specific DNA recombinase
MFCRLSREGGRSVERQEQDGRRLAAERGWEVVEVFKEWASASEFSKKGRREWRRLLGTIEGLRDEIRAGQQYAVILWMEDRSARHIVQAWEFVKLCKDVGLTRIVLPSYEYDLTDPEDEAKFMGEVLHAQREMAKMSNRIRRAQLEAAENGEPHPGGPRRFGTVGVGKSKVSTAQAERECRLIHEAADRLLAGDSLRGIALDWHERGITTSTGRPFQNTTLKQMLMSPRLAGYRVHHTKRHAGQWDAILPVEKWEAVRAVLTDPGRARHLRGATPRYLLSGIVFCGKCERPMYGRIDYRKQTMSSYTCLNRPEIGSCGGIRRDMAKVDALIVEALFRAAEDENEKFDRAKRAVHSDGKNGNVDVARDLYEQLARDTGLLDRLEDKVAEELIKPETAKRKRTEIERRMERTRAKLDQLADSRVRAHIPLPRTLRAEWDGYSLDRKRAILRAVLHKVVINPQRPGNRFDPDAIVPDWKM